MACRNPVKELLPIGLGMVEQQDGKGAFGESGFEGNARPEPESSHIGVTLRLTEIILSPSWCFRVTGNTVMTDGRTTMEY